MDDVTHSFYVLKDNELQLVLGISAVSVRAAVELLMDMIEDGIHDFGDRIFIVDHKSDCPVLAIQLFDEYGLSK